jgi:hypothetical protein
MGQTSSSLVSYRDDDNLSKSQKYRDFLWSHKSYCKSLTQEQYQQYLSYAKERGIVSVKIYDEPKKGFPSICINDEYYDTTDEVDQNQMFEKSQIFVSDKNDGSKTTTNYVEIDIKWYIKTKPEFRKSIQKWYDTKEFHILSKEKQNSSD